MLDPKNIRAPYISREQVFKLADKFRREQANFGQVPVDIERIIEIGEGLKIQPRPDLLKIAGTDALLRRGELVIEVDEYEYTEPTSWSRLRFSLAHELGHHLLHGDIFREVKFSSIEEWILFARDIPLNSHFSFEIQANNFAGRLLVPADELEIEFLKAKRAKGLELDLPVQEEHLELLAIGISKVFNVSPQCILVRIDREGFNSGRS